MKNSNPVQSNVTFAEINDIIWQHLVERDWQNLNDKSLAISISLEANELLEHYQWSDKAVGDKNALGEELADILIYCFEFAQSQKIDMAAAIKDKLAKSEKKYPAEAFKGKNSHETWLKLKAAHKKTGL